MTPIRRKAARCKTQRFTCVFCRVSMSLLNIFNIPQQRRNVNLSEANFLFQKAAKSAGGIRKNPEKTRNRFYAVPISGLYFFCLIRHTTKLHISRPSRGFSRRTQAGRGKPKRQTMSEFFPYYHLALYYRQKEP